MDGRIEPATPQFIAETIRERWGLPVVTPSRSYLPPDVEGLVWRNSASKAQGLVTWAIEGDLAEIVTLEAFTPGTHVGGRLLAAAEADLARRGVRRITVATTNDNLRAFAFYIRRGYRLVRLHLDDMDRARAAKPAVPTTGAEGIPLRDMWELEKEIVSS